MYEEECIPVGCVPPACWPHLPACTASGVSAPGGVPAPGGGVSAPGGDIPACTGADPPVDRQHV